MAREHEVPGIAGKPSHQEPRGNSITRDVTHCHGQPAIGQSNEVVVVASDFVHGDIMNEELETRDNGDRPGQEPFLHVFGQRQIAVQPLGFPKGLQGRALESPSRLAHKTDPARYGHRVGFPGARRVPAG